MREGVVEVEEETEKGRKDSGGGGREREEGEGSGLFINLIVNVTGDSRIAIVTSDSRVASDTSDSPNLIRSLNTFSTALFFKVVFQKWVKK